MNTADLITAGQALAKADRQLKLHRAAGDLYAFMRADEEREHCINMLLLTLGSLLLERDRREQESTQTSPLVGR